LQDFSGPVLKLSSLSAEEIFVLLQKIRDIHRDQAAIKIEMTDQDIHAYMEETLRRMGAKEFTTPRELIREFVNLLNLLVQYPQKTWREIVLNLPVPKEEILPADVPNESNPADDDPLNRFNNFKVK